MGNAEKADTERAERESAPLLLMAEMRHVLDHLWGVAFHNTHAALRGDGLIIQKNIY